MERNDTVSFWDSIRILKRRRKRHKTASKKKSFGSGKWRDTKKRRKFSEETRPKKVTKWRQRSTLFRLENGRIKEDKCHKTASTGSLSLLENEKEKEKVLRCVWKVG